MSSSGERALFDHYRTEVEAMLAVGRPLGAVERMLERAALDADERSVLWLLAWALHENVGEREPIELALVEEDAPDRTVPG
jgi:hypothetical protein